MPADEVIHREYLPFTPQQLNDHFAPAAATGDHLAYYGASGKRAADFKAGPPAGTPAEIHQAIKWGRQTEKDERFWVAATLMQLFHAPDRIDLFARVLHHCLGDAPPDSLPSWEAALGQEQSLYFEANLPSPAGYSQPAVPGRLGDRPAVMIFQLHQQPADHLPAGLPGLPPGKAPGHPSQQIGQQRGPGIIRCRDSSDCRIVIVSHNPS